MKAFVSVIGRVQTEARPIQLIDEPEAFLHPPQARIVAEIIASEGKGQIFLATHSVEVLQGVLHHHSSRVSVVRMTRTRCGNSVNFLEKGSVEVLWKDPILRFSGVLDGLFHEGVIVTEADADCRFYEAIMNSAVSREDQSDIHYTYSGGKDRVPILVAALAGLGALAVVLPEVDALYSVPQRAEFHPEVDTGVHVEMVCDMAAALAPGDEVIGFAALTHDLGKALTPAEELPKHILHEQRGLEPLEALCARLKVPATHRDLARAACREHLNVHRIAELRGSKIHDLIARCKEKSIAYTLKVQLFVDEKSTPIEDPRVNAAVQRLTLFRNGKQGTQRAGIRFVDFIKNLNCILNRGVLIAHLKSLVIHETREKKLRRKLIELQIKSIQLLNNLTWILRIRCRSVDIGKISNESRLSSARFAKKKGVFTHHTRHDHSSSCRIQTTESTLNTIQIETKIISPLSKESAIGFAEFVSQSIRIDRDFHSNHHRIFGELCHPLRAANDHRLRGRKVANTSTQRKK